MSVTRKRVIRRRKQACLGCKTLSGVIARDAQRYLDLLNDLADEKVMAGVLCRALERACHGYERAVEGVAFYKKAESYGARELKSERGKASGLIADLQEIQQYFWFSPELHGRIARALARYSQAPGETSDKLPRAIAGAEATSNTADNTSKNRPMARRSSETERTTEPANP